MLGRFLVLGGVAGPAEFPGLHRVVLDLSIEGYNGVPIEDQIRVVSSFLGVGAIVAISDVCDVRVVKSDDGCGVEDPLSIEGAQGGRQRRRRYRLVLVLAKGRRHLGGNRVAHPRIAEGDDLKKK